MRRYPGLKVIICSGCARNDTDRNFFSAGTDAFIQKPLPLLSCRPKSEAFCENDGNLLGMHP